MVSCPRTTNFGIIQVSLLGPLVSSMYNGIAERLQAYNSNLYTDDTTFLFSVKTYTREFKLWTDPDINVFQNDH